MCACLRRSERVNDWLILLQITISISIVRLCMQDFNAQDRPIRILWNAHLDHDTRDYYLPQTSITPQTAP